MSAFERWVFLFGFMIGALVVTCVNLWPAAPPSHFTDEPFKNTCTKMIDVGGFKINPCIIENTTTNWNNGKPYCLVTLSTDKSQGWKYLVYSVDGACDKIAKDAYRVLYGRKGK